MSCRYPGKNENNLWLIFKYWKGNTERERKRVYCTAIYYKYSSIYLDVHVVLTICIPNLFGGLNWFFNGSHRHSCIDCRQWLCVRLSLSRTFSLSLCMLLPPGKSQYARRTFDPITVYYPSFLGSRALWISVHQVNYRCQHVVLSVSVIDWLTVRAIC